MKNVLAIMSCLCAIATMFAPPARGDDLCPPGWNCIPVAEIGVGPAVDTDSSSPICSIQHIAGTVGSGTALMITSAAVKADSSVDFSFVVDLLRTGSDGKPEPVELNSARIFSYDRLLDTRLWRQTIVAGSNRLVLSSDLDANKPITRTAFRIASGELYGAMIETSSGEKLRFEVDQKGPRPERHRQIMSTFRECILHKRLPAPDTSSRG